MTASASTTSPTLRTTSTSKLITVAAGCFWGVEKVFRKHFQGKRLVDAKVGYANGNPATVPINYKKVCGGATDFAEAVQISYEPSQVSLKEIIEIFFRIHDPTTVNAQGPDVGTQYRSAIYPHDDEDIEVVKQVKEEMQKTWYPNHRIVTQIEKIQVWVDGEDYHQDYLEKNPSGYECPTHFLRLSAKA